MGRAYIYTAVIIILIFGIIAVNKNKNNLDNSIDSNNVDTSGLDSLSQDLKGLGNSVDSLNDGVELDSIENSSETQESSGGNAGVLTLNLDSINDEISSIDSSIGGLNDNADL